MGSNTINMKNSIITLALLTTILAGCSKWQEPHNEAEANYYFDNYCSRNSAFFGLESSDRFFYHCNKASDIINNSIDKLLKDETLNKLVRKSLEEYLIDGSSSRPTCSFKGWEEMDPYCIAINKRLSQLKNNGNYSAREIQQRYLNSKNEVVVAYRKAQAESQANLILQQAEK